MTQPPFFLSRQKHKNIFEIFPWAGYFLLYLSQIFGTPPALAHTYFKTTHVTSEVFPYHWIGDCC